MSDSSREESPDWLRSFQAPAQSAVTLSSGSESPVEDGHSSDDEDRIHLNKLFQKEPKEPTMIKKNENAREPPVKKTVNGKSPDKNQKAEHKPGRKRKKGDHDGEEDTKGEGKVANRRTPEKPIKPHERNHRILSLSSDSESSHDISPIKKNDALKEQQSAYDEHGSTESEKNEDVFILDMDGEFRANEAPKVQSPGKKLKKDEDQKPEKKNASRNTNENDHHEDFLKKQSPEKHLGPSVSSSRLPLVLPEKLQRSKALVECEDDSIDLSGDSGAVGRIIISDDTSRNHEMLMDLKGTIYKTAIVPSRTFCVVSFGQSEAKIEAIMNDFIQLRPQSNVYDAETMVEGTLDGFSFDSEDEPDNVPKVTAQNDKNEATGEKPKGKAKRKAEKTSEAIRKKGNTAGVKAPRKTKKKQQVPKRGKTKK